MYLSSPVRFASVAAGFAILCLAWSAQPGAQAPAGTTAFDGARVIVGDGSAPIENATIVVTGGRIAAGGPGGKVTVPAGATRVSLAGKTVMPTIVDTHVHLSTTRDAAGRRPAPPRLFRRQRRDEPGPRPAGRSVPGARRSRRPGAARYFLAGRGITMPEQGRTDVPYWVTTEAEARKAVQEQAALKVDFIKIWVDDRDGKYKKMPPEIYTAGHRRGAQGQAPRRRPHLQPVGCQGPAQGRHRRLRPRHPRRRRRRRGGGAGQGAAERRAHPQHARPRRGGRLQLAEGQPARRRGGEAPGRGHRSAAGAAPPGASRRRNLKKLSDAGMTITVGTDGNTAWAPHVEMEDMVAVGDDARRR